MTVGNALDASCVAMTAVVCCERQTYCTYGILCSDLTNCGYGVTRGTDPGNRASVPSPRDAKPQGPDGLHGG